MSSQAVVAQEDKELQIMLKLADSEGVSKFLFFPCPVASVSLSSAAQQPKTVEDQRGRTEPEGTKH